LTPKPDSRELDDREKTPMIGPGNYGYDGHAVDEFLWKGDPKATLIQRVGLFIFASMFLSICVGFIVVIVVMVIQRDWVTFLMGLGFATLSGIAGFRFLLNAFRLQKHHRPDRQPLPK
jgi:hypothetical protein